MYSFDLKRKFENEGFDEEIKDTFQFYNNIYNQYPSTQLYSNNNNSNNNNNEYLNNNNNNNINIYNSYQIKKKIKHDNTVSSLQQRNEEQDYFNNYLSVELIVKIFSLCDPFSTPLLYVCKYWYQILLDNQTSLWRDIRVSISDKKPFSYTPKCESIISFFKTGYAKGLHHFSITPSLSTAPIPSSSSSSSSFYSSSSYSRSRYRDYSQRLPSPPHCNYKTTMINLDDNNNNNNSNNNNKSNQQKQQQQQQHVYRDIVNFTKIISENLTCCLKLLELNLTVPLNNQQLYNISSHCKYLTSLNFNSLLISDQGMRQSLSVMKNLQNLSIMASGNVNLEFIKRLDEPWTPKSTISPLTLHSIATYQKNLKSLKFSLLPHFTNQKELLFILSQQQQQQNNNNDQDNHQTLQQHNIIGQDQSLGNNTSMESMMILEQSFSSLCSLKNLHELELINCNIPNHILDNVLEQLICLEKLVLYRNANISLLKFNSKTLKHLSISSLSMLNTIDIESDSLEEFSSEGCESLTMTRLEAPNLVIFSFDSCSGKIKLPCAHKLSSLSLFECRDLSQKSLERLLDSLSNLKEFYVYLQQIENLRICSSTLKKLDIEAWHGIVSCILDCPKLEELKASESSLETIFLNADHVNNIELDFCDSLRTILINVLSCDNFSFTQNHPSPSSNIDLDHFNHFDSLNGSNTKIYDDNDDEYDEYDEDDEDEEDVQVDQQENIESSPSIEAINSRNRNTCSERSNQSFFSPVSLFFQSQYFIQNCTILSGNIVGKLSSKVIGSLSIDHKSLKTFVYDTNKVLKLTSR
ncbi:hypothetical protein CYY_001375 [Polysphondylium violaceum]|uniref:F-box domain-containing protein n=1 Tax=Polysphondylium violaceum TaxID=133409 RepID=A0A8J4VAM6_9MYCE|nr:hypothetical protein CYY_001375 [Polysphondylium violaceum]